MLSMLSKTGHVTLAGVHSIWNGIVLATFAIISIACQQPPGTTTSVATTRRSQIDSPPTLILPEPVIRATPETTGVSQGNQNKTADSYRWNFSSSAHVWKYIVIHHTATERGSVASIHKSHLQRKDAAGNPWRGIGYHFVIGNGNGMEDGEVESTFRWDEQTNGAHAGVGKYNYDGIGICLIGNFDEHAPTAGQLASLKTVISELQTRFEIESKNIIGHRDVKSTKCPGKFFPFDEITSTLDAKSGS